MNCLQNPSQFARISSLLSFDKLHQLYSFWNWGVLILVFLATFTMFIHRTRVKSIVSCQESCPQQIFDDDDFDIEVSDDDDTRSSVAESDDEAFDSEDYRKPAVEVFRAEGCYCYCGNDRGQEDNSTLRRRSGYSWSEFSAGKSVVQLWDGFGLGLDFQDNDSEYESEVAIWDLDRDVKGSSGWWWRSPAAAANVVVTAEINNINDCSGLGASNDSKTPAMYAAWPPRQRKVYVKDYGAEIESATKSWQRKMVQSPRRYWSGGSANSVVLLYSSKTTI